MIKFQFNYFCAMINPIQSVKSLSFKSLQKNHIIAVSLLFIALLGWLGGIDKTFDFVLTSGYEKSDYQAFAQLRPLLEKVKTETKGELGKIQGSIKYLEEKKPNIDQAQLHYFYNLNKKAEIFLQAVEAVEKILPENGDIFKARKSKLKEEFKNLKHQSQNYLEYSKKLSGVSNKAATNLSYHLSRISVKSDYVSEKLAENRNRLIYTFGTLKIMNGAISVIQSVETGVGVISANFGEIFDSLNDTIEQASEYVFLAFCSIFIQELLFKIGNDIAFSFLLPIGLVFGAISYLVKQDELKIKLVKFCNFLIITALFAKFFIPLSVSFSDYIMNNFLYTQFEYAIEQIEENKGQLEVMQNEDLWDKMSPSWVKNAVEKIKNVTFENIFILAAIFLFDTILLPLATGYIMLKSFRFALFLK